MSAGNMAHQIWQEKELKHRARGGRGAWPPICRMITQYYEPRQEDVYHLPGVVPRGDCRGADANKEMRAKK